MLLTSGALWAQVRAPEHEREVKPEFEVRGQVYVQYRAGSPNGQLPSEGEPQQSFVVDSARLGVGWERGPVRAQVEVEMFDANSAGELRPAARDVWIQYRFARELRLRVGQFKKPFSLLRTESRADLPFVFRGMVVERLIDDLGYGGRDIGAAVSGRVGNALHVSYALGVFNGSGANDFESDPNSAKDLVWRTEFGWKKLCNLGLELSHQSSDPATHPTTGGTLYGADLTLKLGRFLGMMEGHFGQDPGLPALPITTGLIGAATYRFKLSKHLTLEPLLGREMYVPDTRRSLRYFRDFVGANLYVSKQLRLMLDAEQTHSPGRADPTRAFVFQVAFTE